MVSRFQTQTFEPSLAPDFPVDLGPHATIPEEGSSHNSEVQLILACARTTIDEATAARIKSLLTGKIDWTYLLNKANKHGVMPLLCRSLEHTFPELVPYEVLDSLRGAFRRNAFKNLLRTKELLSIVEMLELRRIPALPFKGPLLAIQAFGDLGLRQFGDLDILVHKRHIKRVNTLLLANGYRLASPLSWISEVSPTLSPRKDIIFVHDEKGIIVELHWRLTGRHFDLPLDMKDLWRRLVSMSYAGATVRSLPVEDLVLYLCMHGARHSWERLAWICDVAELVRLNPETDWNRLMDRAVTLGSERMLALGLLLASNLLGTTLPENVSKRIQGDPNVKLVAERVREILFQEEEKILDISYWFRHHLMMRERSQDRARLYLHYIKRYVRLVLRPNVQDDNLVMLPQSLSFVYYVIRPIRLAKAHGPSMYRSLVRRIFRRH